MQPKPGIVNVGPQLFRSSQSPSEPQKDNDTPPNQAIPLEPLAMPPQLATTLEHIVGQLDILTQVSYVMVQYVVYCVHTDSVHP